MQFDQLKKELVSEIKVNLKNTKDKLTSDNDEPEEPLLLRAILDTPIPQKSHLPSLDEYDGSTNRVGHAETYKSMMHLFSITLQGSARKYWLVTPHSILTWKQLRKAFIAYFEAHPNVKHFDTYLLYVKQRHTECQRDYIKIFLSEQIKVESYTNFFS